MANGAPTAPYISGTTRRFFGPNVGCYVSNGQVGTVLVKHLQDLIDRRVLQRGAPAGALAEIKE